jgi:hypothetical protein
VGRERDVVARGPVGAAPAQEDAAVDVPVRVAAVLESGELRDAPRGVRAGAQADRDVDDRRGRQPGLVGVALVADGQLGPIGHGRGWTSPYPHPVSPDLERIRPARAPPCTASTPSSDRS